MSMKNLYKSRLPVCIYLFANGKPAVFAEGKYATNHPDEVEALNKEVAYGHPHIYIDAEESEIDSKYQDPMEAIRARIISDYIAQQAAATNPANDRGTTDMTEKLKGISTSATVAAHASGSSSGSSSV